MKSADEVFSHYLSKQDRQHTKSSDRKSGYAKDVDAPKKSKSKPHVVKEPTEVILRGYASPSQQYAAINHYEQLAGRICEDYPREPPMEARRYKSELRDPAFIRDQPLTSHERHLVSRIANGEHWVKITFESAEAAESATYASPQKILGHLVYAELFVGRPPAEDAAVLDMDVASMDPLLNYALGGGRRPSNRLSRPKSWHNSMNGGRHDSPHDSMVSSQTADTATASTATAMDVGEPPFPTRSTSTSALPAPGDDNNAMMGGTGENEIYCRRLPMARRATLKPAEEALAPQASPLERLLACIPLVGWFSGSIIGNQVPRNDLGDFDMARASLYWQIMFFLDLWFGLFGKELVTNDKED